MSDPGPSPRCSDAARLRGDPPLGTAPQTRRWLLLEHFGPWKSDAVAGSGIAPHILRRLSQVAAEVSARILLIRRPGRRRPARSRAWAVAIGGDTTVWGGWRADRDLELAAEVLAWAWPEKSHSGEPLLLVCAHGVHDACCAVRGRPVAAALQARWPEHTWECSHVGGDRFAANLVVLPDGVYYGGLDAGSAVDVVSAHLEGRVSATHLRGFAAHPPPVQVAVGTVHARYGPLGPADVEVRSVEGLGPHRWRVRATVPNGPRLVEILIQTGPAPPARLTCAALRETSATRYRVASLREL